MPIISLDKTSRRYVRWLGWVRYCEIVGGWGNELRDLLGLLVSYALGLRGDESLLLRS